MNIDQDIQSHKIRYSLECIHWTCLFKSIKDKSTP
jgi:predicted transcriptional regulator